MNTPLRRAALALSVLLAGYVGLWALVAPQSFYDDFPGFGLHWVSVDGPYNEHLVRDVGGLYTAFAVSGVAAALSRLALPSRILGIGWSVFGLAHFGYHLMHLQGSMIDRVGNVVSLGLVLALGLVLIIPGRRVAVTEEVPA